MKKFYCNGKKGFCERFRESDIDQHGDVHIDCESKGCEHFDLSGGELLDYTTRNLDGCYFRVERNGKYENICFSDLTDGEREFVMTGRNEEWLKSLCCHLADCLQYIGNELDVIGEYS